MLLDTCSEFFVARAPSAVDSQDSPQEGAKIAPGQETSEEAHANEWHHGFQVLSI